MRKLYTTTVRDCKMGTVSEYIRVSIIR